MNKRSALLFMYFIFYPFWMSAFEKNMSFDVCNNVNWATWNNFGGFSATGRIVNGSENIDVTMTSNFTFSSTPQIYNHIKFASYPATIPNTTVPRTTWSAGAGGTTNMCFSKIVTNPVLLLASLGASDGTASRLSFSKPYVVLFDGGGMQFHDSYSLTGIEGYAIVMFPGEFDCVTVNSTTPENYTNITWGLRPPPFPIDVSEVKGCTEVTLTASGGVSYQWNGGLTPNQAVNKFTTSGTYIVTATDVSGCNTSVSKQVTISPNFANVAGNTSGCGVVTLTASGGVSYQWSTGNSPNTASNTFTSSGNYSVTVTSADGCTQLINKTVTVNNSPSASIVDNSVACSNTSSLTASGGISYQWSGGLTPNQANNTFTSSGTYSVTVTGANGCTTTLSKTVTIGTGQTTINGNDVGCNSITLTATGGIVYRWNGGSTPNQASNTFTTSGTYNVTITDANGCISTLQKTVTISPNVVPSLNIMASANSICADGIIRFTPSYTNAGTTPSFKWFKNGTQVATSEIYITSRLQNNDEIYCEITGSDACSISFNSNKVIITINPIPSVSFDADIVIENDGPKILKPEVSDNGTSYSWWPVMGLDNPNVKNPQANPEFTTEYTLKVTTAAGCSSQATVKVTVLKDIFIPNVFSPNGDGKNDVWVIRNISDYAGTKVQIFNRYGQKVFQNDNFIMPWDGVFGGKLLPTGSYYYILDLANKSKKRYTGSVTILR